MIWRKLSPLRVFSRAPALIISQRSPSPHPMFSENFYFYPLRKALATGPLDDSAAPRHLTDFRPVSAVHPIHCVISCPAHKSRSYAILSQNRAKQKAACFMQAAFSLFCYRFLHFFPQTACSSSSVVCCCMGYRPNHGTNSRSGTFACSRWSTSARMASDSGSSGIYPRHT